MELKELVESIRSRRPDLFGGGQSEASAAELLRVALEMLAAELNAAPPGQLTVEGLGRVRVRQLAREGKADERIVRLFPEAPQPVPDAGARPSHRPQLILHAGAHKTGTTAIQAFAHRNRPALADRGVLYPEIKAEEFGSVAGHHAFAHAIAGQSKYFSVNDAGRMARAWHTEACASGSRVLVSAEPLFRRLAPGGGTNWLERRRAYLRQVADALSAFDITVIIVLRRQDDYIRSLYQEHVARDTSAGTLAFAEFREKYFEQAQFRENVELFEEVFPGVRILVYEDFPRGDRFCEHFFAEIGIDASRLAPVGIVRQSLTVAETLAKRFLNMAIATPRQNRAVVDWLRTDPVQDLLRRHLGDCNDLWESHQERAAFLSSFEQDNRWVLEHFFNGRDRLFPALEPGNASAEPPDFTGLMEKLAAQLESESKPPIRAARLRKQLASSL